MAWIGLLAVFSTAFICFLGKKPHASFPRNWPFVGMLPGVLVVLHRLYDWVTEILENSDLTFAWKGPWFMGMDILATVDPSNIHHVMSSNFSNYTKGPEFKEVFDVLGDGIFTADSELWENLRKSSIAILNHRAFQRHLFTTNMNKLKNGLVPLLDHVAEANMVVDLQDVFQRYVFDTTFTMCTGYDPETLSIEMPEAEFSKAFDVVEEAIVYRHVKPRILWKLQSWIGLGVEKKMRRAQATLNRICARHVSTKRKEMSSGVGSNVKTSMDLLTSYMNVDTTKYQLLSPCDEKFQRDVIMTFMTAGRGTGYAFAWLFLLLSKNPQALNKIRQEITTTLPRFGSDVDEDERMRSSLDPVEMKKLVYLHAALLETLRLYPVVPFQRKSPTRPDVLPSGHRVETGSKIMIFMYALGRMRAVWGQDALEFRPERWISERGGLKHEPPSKFFSFNAGPRICLGKDVALTQLKTVLVDIIQRYDFNVVEGQRTEANVSVLLRIKDGLKVTVTKRDALSE